MVSHAVQDKMAVEKMKTVIIYKHWKENRLESVTREGIVSGEYFILTWEKRKAYLFLGLIHWK